MATPTPAPSPLAAAETSILRTLRSVNELGGGGWDFEPKHKAALTRLEAKGAIALTFDAKRGVYRAKLA